MNLSEDALVDSVGLMGDRENGYMMGRDDVTRMEGNPNAFAHEWQVLESKPKLFRTDRFPQNPHDKCILPQIAQAGRRLGTSNVSKE